MSLDRKIYMKEYTKTYRAKNRDKYNAYMREYAKGLDKEEVRLRRIRYYEDNPDKLAAAKLRIAEHQGRVLATVPGRLKFIVRTAKVRAKKAGIAFDLDISWAEEQYIGYCPMTGIKFDLTTGVGRGSINKNAISIDRIDPKKGYTKDNCRFVAWHYNVAKSIYTDLDVVELAKNILENTHVIGHPESFE